MIWNSNDCAVSTGLYLVTYRPGIFIWLWWHWKVIVFLGVGVGVWFLNLCSNITDGHFNTFQMSGGLICVVLVFLGCSYMLKKINNLGCFNGDYKTLGCYFWSIFISAINPVGFFLIPSNLLYLKSYFILQSWILAILLYAAVSHLKAFANELPVWIQRQNWAIFLMADIKSAGSF